MAHHDLKTDGPVFEAVMRGDKTHEIRFNDRNFQVGDTMTLHETQFTGAEMKPHHDGGYPGSTVEGKPLVYTGRTVGPLLVTHVLDGYGYLPGWVDLSFRPAVPVIKSVEWQKGLFEMTFRGLRPDGSGYEYKTTDIHHAIETMALDINRRAGK